MKVKNAYKKFSKDVDMVKLKTPINQVIHIFAKNRERRSVYVVDDSKKLIGIITVKGIFTSLRPDITLDEINFFLKGDRLKTAEDVMVEPKEAVTLDDSMETGLRKAVILGMRDVPVCKNGKLIGELDVFELVYGLSKSHMKCDKKSCKKVKIDRG